MKRADNYSEFVCFLFCGQGQHWPSSMLPGSNQISDNPKILLRDLETILSRRIDSPSYPCALLGFKATINLEINCSSKFIVFTVSFVGKLTEKGMELSTEIAVHC